MNKITLAACAMLMLASCKNPAEEPKTEVAVAEKGTNTNDASQTAGINESTEVAKAVAPATEEVVSKEPIAKEQTASDIKTPTYASFGTKFTPNNALTNAEMLKKYKSMKAGDTINVKFASTVREVCKKKGCWMSMALPGEKESFVRFKDYGFFVPLNADKSDAIVSGKAFLEVVPVSELKHYAKDGGKSEEEIAKITEPKITYAFTADGVLIKE
jgi:hypothetical protein